jgi:transposase-like protein
MITGFKSIFDLLKKFPDEQACIEHMEMLRWGGNVVSPFDPTSKVYKCPKNRYKCKNTNKYFNVRTGSVFENTNLPLLKWFMALYIFSSHKKGISSHQLARDLDITQKSAWFVLHRLRELFKQDNEIDSIGLEDVVEIDETFVGGKNKNRHKSKKVENSQGRSFKDKTPVLGILERNGKLFAIPIPDTQQETIHPIIEQMVVSGAKVVTDEWGAYKGLESMYDHKVVNHSEKEFVNKKDRSIHNNSLEGAWSLFKRGIIGIYHWNSRKHMKRYVNEFVLRYNTRTFKTSDRFDIVLSNFNGRLTYKMLIQKNETPISI